MIFLLLIICLLNNINFDYIHACTFVKIIFSCHQEKRGEDKAKEIFEFDDLDKED